MSNDHPDHTLPISEAGRVESLRQDFQRAWNNGGSPRLEDFLDRIDSAARSPAFRELLKVEIAQRRIRQQPVSIDELAGRFPGDVATIRKLVESDAASDSGRRRSGLHVRCPHCANPIELVPDAELDSIHCGSCGSQFSLTANDHGATRDSRTIAQIGHFKLIERIGLGAFGAVWKALDTELDRTVAVKIPRSGQLDKQHQDFFFREARSAAQLHHPNIVPVYEVGREGDTLYIVSEFVRGVTLADRLTAGPMSARESAQLCATIADALHHAHEQAVVHRDLKPGNIMLDGHGAPHLMDFGLARREAGEITMTLEGQVLGTPAYMSPEQAQGESHVADRRSDVYSLGVIMFELLTGELPFRGNSRMMIHQVIHDDPPSPRKLNAAVPKDLETLTLKCMEKDPKRRFATAAELGDEFRRYLAGEPILARPISQIERAWRWCRRKPVVAGLSAALAALVAFVAVAGPIAAVQQAALRRTAEEQKQAAVELQKSAERSEEKQKLLAAAETKAREAAELSKQTLAAAQEASERTVYARTISLAQQEWANANITQCEDLLDATSPKFRDWEWQYLKQLCHSDVNTLRSFRNVADGIAFHKDGSHLVTYSSGDRLLAVLDQKSGEISTLNRLIPYALSQDGATVAGALGASSSGGLLSAIFGQNKSGVIVWDVMTNKQVAKIAGHAGGGIAAAALNADGTRLVTRSGDFVVRIWDARTGKQIQQIEQPVKESDDVIAISPNGARVGWKSSDGSLVVYDVDSGQQVFKQRESGYWKSRTILAFDADARRMASTIGDQISIWDVDSGQRIARLHGHRGLIQAFAFSPTESLLASCGSDSTARLWDAETGRELLCLRGHKAFKYGVWSIAFNADGSRVATGGIDGTIKIWDAHAGDKMPAENFSYAKSKDIHDPSYAWQASPDPRQDLDWLFGHERKVNDIAFTPDSKFLITASTDNAAKVWDVAARKLVRTFKEHDRTAFAVDVAPDGDTVATGGGGLKETEPGEIYIWSLATGKVIKEFREHVGPISRLCFSADGQRLASASGNQSGQEKGEWLLWDVPTGKALASVRNMPAGVVGMDLSPDGSTIATCGFDGLIKLWEAPSGKFLRTIGQNGEVFLSVAFAQDGSTLAAGSNTHSVAIYDVATGAMLWKKFEHSGPVCDVNFANDQRLLSTSYDGSARLWDRQSGDSLLALRDFPTDMYGADMSPDGRTIACCGVEPRVSLRTLSHSFQDDGASWKVIFEDSFERQEFGPDWKFGAGSWKIVEGAAQGTLAPIPGNPFCFAGLMASREMPRHVDVSYDAWGSQPVVVETKLDAGAHSINALYIGAVATPFNRGEQGFAVVVHSGKSQFVDVASRRADFSFVDNRKYRLRTVRNNDRWRMFVDDQLVLESEFPDSRPIPTLMIQGGFGRAGTVINIDNVVVRAPADSSAPSKP